MKNNRKLPIFPSQRKKLKLCETSSGPETPECLSLFRSVRQESLSLSLLRPSTPIDQENAVLVAQNIGKQYQLAAKNYNIKVRESSGWTQQGKRPRDSRFHAANRH